MRALLLLVLLSLARAGTAAAPESVYTELSIKNCPVVHEDDETGGTRQVCAGPGGYRLEILDDDDRVSLNVIAPDGTAHPLDLWRVVTKHFSSHGKKAEWRIREAGGKTLPTALIVRVESYETGNPRRPRSYLAVAKITSGGTCVTDKIPPGPRHNERARRAADSAPDRPCLEAPKD